MEQSLNLVLLNVGYAKHNADWNWKGTHSPFARLYLVETGKAHIIIGKKLIPLTPGHLYLIPSFTTHDYVCKGIFTLFYIHIYDEQNIFERLSFPFEVGAGALEELIVQRLLSINPGRELKMYDPHAYDNTPTFFNSIAQNSLFPFYSIIETKGILLQLFSKFLMNATLKQEIVDKRIIRVVQYIRDNIEQELPINELSAICSLTNDHFIRIFKKELKYTPIQYINQKKIERAQMMLLVEGKQVKEISYQLSFENVSYFNRLFKNYTGMTPNEYREKLML
ncbi:MAG: AraC family transcriptional regulator [Prevotellaceae bacterium]|jgi:AraC-like DNA-binding protein|nr:AraC family transcriptional regulator [Prevotellaceae bacterium]